ncbi:MAG: non-reducing end alpha-L-arabinofuranosidase family hydrolase [Bryobacteraceae bacterium]|nr:non-reducing end alpha-L-arabinofuranosidase family hydrolase [Bryobacteraceae bacterium]
MDIPKIIIAFLMGAAALAGPSLWTIGPVVLEPGSPDSFDSVAVKDPSVVRHAGRWHVFYTARNQTDYTLGYVSAKELTGLGRAERFPLTQLHAKRGKYAAAPQVFYFRPHKKWYLIFQTDDSNYQPVYSSTADISDPASWTAPRPLLEKSERAKWIDFWVICDDRRAYLFLTRDHKDVVAWSTDLDSFPSGFAEPRAVFSPVHEAVHVYREAGGGPPRFVMLYEQQEAGGRRRFGLARSGRLDGDWRVAEENFATAARLSGSPGNRWTDEVSHGELLRSGFDERLEIPGKQWKFLIQGMRRDAHFGEYPLLPWKLGLISLGR